MPELSRQWSVGAAGKIWKLSRAVMNSEIQWARSSDWLSGDVAFA